MSTIYTDDAAVDLAYGPGTAQTLRIKATVAQVEQVRSEHGSGWWTRRYQQGLLAVTAEQVDRDAARRADEAAVDAAFDESAGRTRWT